MFGFWKKEPVVAQDQPESIYQIVRKIFPGNDLECNFRPGSHAKGSIVFFQFFRLGEMSNVEFFPNLPYSCFTQGFVDAKVDIPYESGHLNSISPNLPQFWKNGNSQRS